MANQSNTKRVDKFRETVVFAGIFAILGTLGLVYTTADVANGQSPATTGTQPQVSDFEVVHVQQHLGDNKSDLFAPSYPYRGDVSDTFNFTVDSTPIGSAYLLVQVYGSYFQG